MWWKTKEYEFIFRGCSSIKDVHNYVSDINNCKFCNNGSFYLKLKNIPIKQKDFCTAVIKVEFREGLKSKKKFRRMINCSFCNKDRGVLVLKRKSLLF